MSAGAREALSARGMIHTATPAAIIVGAGLAAALFGLLLVAIAVEYGGDAAPVLMLGLPLAGIFSLLVLWLPTWGVLAVFAAFPMGTLALPGTPLEVVEALVLAVAVLLAFHRLGQGQTMLPWVGPMWWALALIAWSIVCLESAIDHDLGIRQILQLTGGLLFASVVIGVCRNMNDLRRVLGGITAVGAFIAALALTSVGNITIVLGGAVAEGRLHGAFTDPNQLGAFSAMTLFPAIGLLGGSKTKRARILSLVALVLISAALLLSLSRGAWVGVVLGIVFLLVTVQEFRRLLLGFGIPAVIVASALGAFAPDAPQVQVVQARLRSFTVLSPYDARDQIWAEGLREMRENAITGVGPGSFPVASLRSASGTSTVFAEHAHSIFFTWGAETGVPGLLIVIGIMVALAATGRRTIQTARRWARNRDRILISGVAAGLVTVVGHGLVDYNLRNTVIHLAVWSLIGALLAASRLQTGGVR